MNHHLADQLEATYDSLWRTIDLLEPAEMEMGHLENKRISGVFVPVNRVPYANL